ncbi:DMT family transporter [Papillibacter cinnamivorans]|uniref:Transporter family-2 protein n=1 Tax=Papillibacter cinnamivorans DSM 12816 TaxID=1122930 RepID=A0A1W2CCB3_9FIRM|nr:DMT family transporter [Papillibacter cinnamivorans]SMC82522.1 transporter family-2 protein [Papillibacter cinnamivorans DSM 12816]
MKGIVFAVMAGTCVALQSTFNSRLSEKIGVWESNAVVMAVGLAVALILVWFLGDGSISNIREVNPLYLTGGILGVIIVFSAIRSVSLVGIGFFLIASFAAQIVVGFLVDSFGLFGLPKVAFSPAKLAGIALILAGAFLYRLK